LDTAVAVPEGADGTATEREMFATLNRINHEVKSKINTYLANVQTQEDALQSHNVKKARIEEEIARLMEQMAELDRQMKLTMFPEGVEEKKKDLEEELERLKKEIEGLDGKLEESEKTRKAAHNALLEVSAQVTGEQAAMRRFTNEKSETVKRITSENRSIAEVLGRFDRDYLVFSNRRGTLQKELDNLEKALSEWVLLFKEERDRRQQAMLAVRNALAKLTDWEDGLQQIDSAPIFHPKSSS
jgi:chromosome segregation ATPase